MRYTLIAFLFLAVLASCDRNDSEVGTDTSEQKQPSVSVMCQQRNVAQGIDIYSNDDDAPIIIDKFKQKDLLYFSQMGASQDPNFLQDLNLVDATQASPYLYIYEYKDNTSANWNDGYNFFVHTPREEFDWEKVKTVGSVGNSFSFYAFHFPVDNEVRFHVEQNQKGEEDEYDKENFMKSDIMGAYHATSSLYTRLRFRLFHLMVYLKVTLYVPVYKDEEVTSGDNPQYSFSGFNQGAVKGAFVMNAHTDFSVEWRANRSSDTEAPLTKAGDGEKKNITMYRHKSDETTTKTIQVPNYYNGDRPSDEDEVREYNFSVLFPSQEFGDNFLCFALQSPPNEKDATGAMKYYYFSGSQIIGDKGNYALTQGTLQQLYLYLPRKTNETILVGAKILPWQDAFTDMTVTKKTE